MRCRQAFQQSKSKASKLVSNTPLQWVVETEPRRDTLAFQVDLWSARGEFPRNIFDVMTRDKEIRYAPAPAPINSSTSKKFGTRSRVSWKNCRKS